MRVVNVAKKTHILKMLSVRKDGATRRLIIIKIKSRLNLGKFGDLGVSWRLLPLVGGTKVSCLL